MCTHVPHLLQLLVDALKDTPLLAQVVNLHTQLGVGCQGTVETYRCLGGRIHKMCVMQLIHMQFAHNESHLPSQDDPGMW